jgi:hypothetical protein
VRTTADPARTKHDGYEWLNAARAGTWRPSPAIERAKPTETQQELMATRADLFAAYAECQANGDEIVCEQIADSVAELDAELRATGVRVG